MENYNKLRRMMGVAFTVALLFFFLSPEIVEARRGGFRSFGRSRSFSRMRKSPSSRSRNRRARTRRPNKTSFGGSRLNSSKQYTSKYGKPTKSTPMRGKNAQGATQNYVVHSYGGGFGNGLMMGYMMGASPWYWGTPFHGAYYYSRPHYAENTDGTVGVYPPTFNFSKLLFTLMIIFAVIFIIRRVVFAPKTSNNRFQSTSSFG